MGYTHYMRNKPEFTDAQWSAFCLDLRDLLANSKVPIVNAHGDRGTKAHIGRAEISFNGREDDSHETCWIPKAAEAFLFVKTARKPYDEVVVAVFKLVRRYLPQTILSSDGGDEIFGGKKIIVNGKWTYLTGGFDVKVGDTVLLPSGVKYRYEDTWEGTVTAIGSKYTGDCKTILGVVLPKVEIAPAKSLRAELIELVDNVTCDRDTSKDLVDDILSVVRKHLS